ncbi:hypothetical protein BU23DRAFT_25217 [Bimuria novae-zelandiae CBS 107.79]|uniref:MARVEL domain-containing protein n=1 Tax=Bimuria novae-zelandiae CBS 107.79 TaxID=1447943 RepID=A0A6A5URC6_9PLEO|nr:hypothetical protein BU23DRAFT_25217 [Bimuria novae-zelandiae CBS 107.79]
MSNMAGTQSRDHIPRVHSAFKFIVIAKIVIAVVVLGLATYGATFNDFFAGNGYAIFCCIALLLTEGYYLAATIFFTHIFNPWVYLVMSLFQAVWWLACWANLASWASAYKLVYLGLDLSDVNDCSDKANQAYDSTEPDSLNDWDDAYLKCLQDRRRRHRDAIGAAAGIGALEWILVVVTLVLFALALRRHRRSGAPFSAGAAWRTTSENPHGVAGAGAGTHVESHQMQTKPKTAV